MQSIFQITLLVPDYDQAIGFYYGKLGFEIIEDTRIDDSHRWVVIGVNGGCNLVLATPENAEQVAVVGQQVGGRVGFFLATDDIHRDFALYKNQEVEFIQNPTRLPHGTVAIFKDPFGNSWDLIELPHDHRAALESG